MPLEYSSNFLKALISAAAAPTEGSLNFSCLLDRVAYYLLFIIKIVHEVQI